MFPYISICNIKIPLYGTCILAGILLTGLICWQLCKRRQQDFLNLILISAVVIAAGFTGAKLLYILVSYPLKFFFKVTLSLIFSKDPSKLASGFVFYGGLILGIPAYFLGVKLAQCKTFEYVDYYAFSIPLVHGFGRLGCFCAGCCYGIPYEGIFAVHYKNPLSKVPVGIGIFPVQLIEALCLIALAIVIILLFLKNKKYLILLYTFSYSILRFVLERYRFDSERGGVGSFSTSQIISLVIFIISLISFMFILIKTNCQKVSKRDIVKL